MELKPTTRDFTAREQHIEAQQAEARAQAALEESRQLEEKAKAAREERLQRYTGLVDRLERATQEITAESAKEGVVYLDTRATEWVPFASSDQSNPLSAECRFITHDTQSTRKDHSQQNVMTRSYGRFIELRWKDDASNYAGKPEVLVRLSNDEISFFEQQGSHHRTLLSKVPSHQYEMDDFMSTMLEPLVAKLDTGDIETNSALDPLPTE